ncbi:MAG: transcription antitermination protein NusB [Saprospiraceae bacterium]|nr:transcription antitermination protein NusB [Saprospiraceae bacterium]
MLSRRQLRIKVMQALYAHYQSDNDRIDKGEKQLLRSVDMIYDLFIYQLSFLIEFFDFSEKRIKDAKTKFFPTQEELNPSTKFIDNKIISQFRRNSDLQKHIERLKINWHDEEEMIRKIYQQFRDGEEYKAYLKSDDVSYQAAKDIIIVFIKNHLVECEALKYYFEEKHIHWVDDYYTVLVLLVNFINSYKENWDGFKKLPGIFKDDMNTEIGEDRKMLIDLYRKTIVHGAEYDEMINEKAKNWEFDRIAKLDIILIKMALSEIIGFPSIPLKVTLNEYIEISKMYSSPKSKVFINGILDKLVGELTTDGKIKKVGRGLME